jgi:hypothetical protein
VVKHHARKNEARGRRETTGEGHQAAVRALTKSAPEQQPKMYFFDIPTPDLGDSEPCPACSGRGSKSGEQAMVRAERLDRPVLLDIVCGLCRGCGRAEHGSCTAGVHTGDSFLPGDDWAHSCQACGGRRFRYVDFSDEDAFGNHVAVYLRQPCGCAQELMREMTLTVVPAAASS